MEIETRIAAAPNYIVGGADLPTLNRAKAAFAKAMKKQGVERRFALRRSAELYAQIGLHPIELHPEHVSNLCWKRG